MGSPPRMRGKGHRIPLRHPLQGITPAYAGKSSACRRTLSAGWDHPRICGEKAEMGGFIPRFSGSPPRMRGKVLPDRGRVLGVGITPAYAGKSFPTSMFRSVGRDHPRICGEKIVVSRTWCSRSGLPPRMWGKVSSIRDDLARVGITPAYAGKSSSPRLIALLIWDHPRVCGEKVSPRLSSSPRMGSPPRMRGKAVRNETGTSWQGITPAYAGKSLLLRQQFFSRWDHPRVCGEKFSAHSARRYRTGSPPRMRGKATRPHAKPRPSRITPAYAGKRRHVQYRPSGNKDHPRVCGEKWKDVPKEIKLKGSPPRMRGKVRL